MGGWGRLEICGSRGGGILVSRSLCLPILDFYLVLDAVVVLTLKIHAVCYSFYLKICFLFTNFTGIRMISYLKIFPSIDTRTFKIINNKNQNVRRLNRVSENEGMQERVDLLLFVVTIRHLRVSDKSS